MSIAEKRDPRIQKTTIFEDSSTFLLCKILSNSKVESVVLSEKPLRTFHCIFQNSVWIPIYVGEFHAVFTDDGNNFPGYLVKKVNFYKWQEEDKQPCDEGEVTSKEVVVSDASDIEKLEEDKFMESFLTSELFETFGSVSVEKDCLDSFDGLFEEQLHSV